MSDAPAAARESRPRRPLWLAGIAAGLTFLAVFGIWNRQQREAEALDSPSAPSGLFRADQARGTSLTAVGRVTGMPLPCTAWLVDSGAEPSDPAHAVMAGRCTGIDDSSTVLAEVPVRGASIEFSTFATLTSAVQETSVPAPIEQVVWASTRGTDLAVVRLGISYGELADRGVRPIRPVAPLEEGGQILVAAVPVDGVPADEQNLRGSRCAIGATTDVVEGPWLFDQMRSSDCEGMLGGSAGSPAFNPEGEAVGMVTTTTIAAPEGPDCGPGRPCEVDGSGVAFRPDRTYLVAVDGLAECFDAGTFTLGDGCPLEDPATVVAASLGSTQVQAGAPIRVRLEEPPTRVVSVLTGMLGAVDCWGADGWRLAPVVDSTLVVTAPGAQGLAAVCVGSPEQPTPLLVTVSGTAPDAGAIELEQTPVAEGVRVAPVPDPPEFSRFTWLVGPAGTTDCATAEGYAQFTGEAALIQAADLPATVCVIAYDESGTASVPTAFPVG